MAAVGTPWQVRLLAFAFTGDDRVSQERVFSDDTDPTAELTGCGRFIPQLVAVSAHREAPFQLLDGVIAGVGDQVVNRIRTIAIVASSIGTFVYFQVDPILTLYLVPTGI